jgi:hypothetical protein
VISPAVIAAASRPAAIHAYDDAVHAFAPNLVAYWKLAETSGTVASDQLAIAHGTYVGTPEYDVATIVQLDVGGTCIALPGFHGNAIDIPHADELKTAQGTIVITFQRDTGSTKAIIVAGDADGAAGGFSMEVSASGALRAFLRRQSDGAAVILLGADDTVEVGKAHTLVFKWGAPGLSYSVWGDGGLIERLTDPLSDSLGGTSAIRVGAWHAGQDRLAGPVGRLAWLDRRITDQEEALLARPRTIERPPTAAEDSALPYGGRGLGCALYFGRPGNYRYSVSCTKVVPVEKIGTPLAAIAWNNRSDAQAGSGYSTGDGGRISVRCRKVELDGDGITLGSILGETAEITDPALTTSWQAAYAAAGGEGSATAQFRNFPTLRFSSPIDLAAAGLTLGDPLAFEFVQHDSSSGTVSVNNAYSDSWKHWGAIYPPRKSGLDPWSLYRFYRNDMLDRLEHFPLILLGYQDGTVKGNPWMGLAGSSAGDVAELVGSTRIRQVIPVPPAVTGRAAAAIHLSVVRSSANTSDGLVVQLRQAGGTPGGAGDEGTLLTEVVIPPTAITQASTTKTFEDRIEPVVAVITPPIALSAGQTYYLEMKSAGSSTTYLADKMHRYTNQAQVGLKVPDHLYSGCRGQMNDGSGMGWSEILGGGGDLPRNDAPLWMAFA